MKSRKEINKQNYQRKRDSIKAKHKAIVGEYKLRIIPA